MSFSIFVKEQLFGKPIAPTTSLEGRTALVTGANTGLGLETAIHLAKLKPKRLIITSRDTTRGAKALEVIERRTGFTAAECWQLDLASFKNVREFGERAKKLDRLDVVIENAGVSLTSWSVTDDGWETTLQVNDISTGLLAVLLLPVLQKTASLPTPAGSPPLKPHLTIVASEVHAFAKFAEAQTDGPILEAFNDEKKANITDRYNCSKLMDIYITQEIAKLPAASGIVVNCANPGLCESELLRDMKGPLIILKALLRWFSRTSEEGSKVLAWAGVEGPSDPPAAYISVSEVTPGNENIRSEEGKRQAEKLWKELVFEYRKVAPETSAILTQ